MRRIIFSLTGCIILLLVACSCSTAKLLPSKISGNAKTISSPEKKALIYVYRKSSFGWLVGLKVSCNDEFLAYFYPKQFYTSIVDPGSYIFTGEAENEVELTVDIEQDKKYYIEVKPRMGLIIARCKLEVIDPRQGESRLKKCKLIGINPEVQKVLNYYPPTK